MNALFVFSHSYFVFVLLCLFGIVENYMCTRVVCYNNLNLFWPVNIALTCYLSLRT